MNTDKNGCSTCPVGQEKWERCKYPLNRRINAVQYDYRHTDGELFSTVALNLNIARIQRDEWLKSKGVNELICTSKKGCISPINSEYFKDCIGCEKYKKQTILQKQDMQNQTITSVLGMILSDLSLKDICEEITDLKRDVAAIEDFEKGNITYSELTLETSFKPADKQKLIDAIAVLKEEKAKRTK